MVGTGELGSQHVVHPAIVKAPPLHGYGVDALAQPDRAGARLRRVATGIAGEPRKTSGPALGDPGVLQHPDNGLALVLRG